MWKQKRQANTIEKSFSCSYCLTRFKNRNEAKRHEKSIHKREESWSCAAILGPEAAFGRVESSGELLDECGYCGMRFANWPGPDLPARSQHLEQIHHFDRCNRDHTFYRADHLKQHLRHSHASEEGRWLDIIRNASHRHCEAGQDGEGKIVKAQEIRIEDDMLKKEVLEASHAANWNGLFRRSP